jgi:opacity protein-like surface antigen
MHKLLVAALTLSLSLAATTAFAALIPDDAETVGQGGVVLELNTEYGYNKESGVRERGGEVEAALTYGLLDHLDLVLAVPYQFGRDVEEGVADVTVELKWTFYHAERGHYALKPAITLPTGDEDKGLGNGKVSYGLTFIASRHFEPADLHLNLGYVHNEFKLATDKDANRDDLWQASLTAVRELTEGISLVGSTAIERNGERGKKNQAYGLVGVIYALTDNLEVDLGVQAGLNRAATDWTVLAGLAWSL